MAKIFPVRSRTTVALRERRQRLLAEMVVPERAVRASLVRQYLTCGKRNCRCRRGEKHGPFEYLVQCLDARTVRKFLLKTAAQKRLARDAVAAYVEHQRQIEELSQINAELLRRGEGLQA